MHWRDWEGAALMYTLSFKTHRSHSWSWNTAAWKNRKAPAELFLCNCPCKKVTNHSIILSLPSDLKHSCSEEQASNLLLMTVFLSIPSPSTNLSLKITFTNRQSFYSEHSFHVLYHFLKCLSQTKENKKTPKIARCTLEESLSLRNNLDNLTNLTNKGSYGTHTWHFFTSAVTRKSREVILTVSPNSCDCLRQSIYEIEFLV